MIWAVASLPFWFMGILLLFVGAFAIGKVMFSEKNQAFESASDGAALKVGAVMVIASGGFLIVAAKLMS